MHRVAILQSNYLPWKGYFRIIDSVDHFLFYDDVQYTKNDWRNRNKIIINGDLKWLTIPVGPSSKLLIDEVLLPNGGWREEHLRKIVQAYRYTDNFSKVYEFISRILTDENILTLSDLNQTIIQRISIEWLKIETYFDSSKRHALLTTKSERVLELCKNVNATHYLSGPAAQSYLKVDDFMAEGITVEWMDYEVFGKYNQKSDTFQHSVSIIDVLFNVGFQAKLYI